MARLPKYSGTFQVGVYDIETPSVLFRLYYPTTTQTTKTSRWLPNPYFYTYGYLNSVHPWLRYLTPLVFPFTYFKKTPAVENGVISNKFPIAVFSHGLMGMRTTYSTLCGDLASNGIYSRVTLNEQNIGMIVASIEHRDGSASRASINNYSDSVE